MIREERNALILLFTFVGAAGLLYALVLRPALDEATHVRKPRRASASTEKTEPSPFDPIDREAARLVTVRGSLRDSATGEPPAGVEATVIGIDDIATPSFRSVLPGEFLVEYLPPEVTFGLVFSANGYEPRSFPRLRETAKQTIDLGVVTLDPIRSIDGTVIDRDGAPIADATIAVHPLVRSRQLEYSSTSTGALFAEALLAPPIQVTQSDEKGGFSLQSLRARSYVVRTSAPGYDSLLLTHIDLERDSAECVVRLRRGVPIEGVLTLDSGEPLANSYALFIEARHPITTQLSVARARTDEAGRFQVAAMNPVPHYVVAAPPGAAVAIGPFDPTAGPLLLTVPSGGSLEGRVLDSNRQVPFDGSVTVHGALPGSCALTVAIDAAGEYHIDGIAVGKCQVTVAARDCAADRSAVSISTRGTHHSVNLLAPGELRGEARDLATDEPVSNCVITVEETGESTVTNAAGEFSLHALPAGRVNIEARGVDFTVEARSGDSITTQVKLPPLRPLRVSIRDDDRRGITAATLVAFYLQPDQTPFIPPRFSATMTEKGGLALFPDLPSGPTVLLSVGASYAPARSEPFASTEGVPTTVSLTLPRPSTIVGSITNAQQQPVAGASVRLIALTEDRYDALPLELIANSDISRLDGSFVFDGVPQGNYRILAIDAANGVGRLESVAVEAGRTTNLGPIRLRVAAGVQGRIGTNGRLATVRLIAFDDSNVPLFQWEIESLDAAGRFTFPPVPAPRFRLEATTRAGNILPPIESSTGGSFEWP